MTVHEILNEEVSIPDITEVDPKETLERVGEILSVLQDRIVIVKGLASQIAGHAPERVLDADTLLLFEDRKVLGYVSPFPHRFVTIVLIPSLCYRSTRHSGQHTNHFIKSGLTKSSRWTRSEHEPRAPSFTSQTGVTSCLSIGSNWQRAVMQVMHTTRNLVKMRLSSLMMNRKLCISAWQKKGFFLLLATRRSCSHKFLRIRRSGSRASSRASTPGAPARRDYDHFDYTFRGNNPYDEHGAYDMNYGAGPSRPPPIPYDDPYSDSFTSVSADGDGGGSTIFNNIRNDTGRQGSDSIRPARMSLDGSGTSGHTNDRNSEPEHRHHGRGRGRGGSRNRQSDRGRRGRGKGALQHSQRHHTYPQQAGSYDYPGLTPPSGLLDPYSHQRGYGGGEEWNYGGFGPQNTFPGVQPHINPKFANQLGFNFSQMSQMPQTLPGTGSPPHPEQSDLSVSHLQAAARHQQWEGGSG